MTQEVLHNSFHYLDHFRARIDQMLEAWARIHVEWGRGKSLHRSLVTFGELDPAEDVGLNIANDLTANQIRQKTEVST
jgi:hypothetical protein